jgi:hypothetical protein
MSSVYYTLFVFDKDANKWVDVFGATTRAECVEEGQEYFGQRKKIMKSDGTLVGLMKNYAELGQRVQDLEPHAKDLVIFQATQFPHEDDHYLYHILGHFKGQWISAVFNNGSKGFYYTHYFGEDQMEAQADYRAHVGDQFDCWTRGQGRPKFASLEEAYEAAMERRDSLLVFKEEVA